MNERHGLFLSVYFVFLLLLGSCLRFVIDEIRRRGNGSMNVSYVLMTLQEEKANQ